MKRKLLPLAIGAAIAMPGVAMAEPVVYGKVNVSFENADVDNGDDSADQWEVNSNASRLGVKGSEKISDSLSAVYKAEFEISVDDGDKSGETFGQRNIYGGLKGGFGEVIVGKFDTPLKTAQNKIDQFNDMSNGDIKNVITGENRASNLIQYSTPDMGGITAKLAIQPGEDRDDGDPDTDDKDGIADGFSLSVAFEQDNLYLALAHDSEIESGVTAVDFATDLLSDDDIDDISDAIGVDISDGLDVRMDVTRLVGQFNMDAFEFGALYQMAEDSEEGDAEETGYILSGAFKVGANKFKAQYGASEFELDGVSETLDITQLALGMEHKLSKQTKLFTHYIMKELEVGDGDAETTNIAFGMEHKF